MTCWPACSAATRSRATSRNDSGAGAPRGPAPDASYEVLLLAGAGQLRGALRQRALAVGGLVGVDDALAGGLVELLAGGLHQLGGGSDITGAGSLGDFAVGGFRRGLDRFVAQASLLVGLVALDLRLDVGHGEASSFCRSGGCGRATAARSCPPHYRSRPS